MGISDCGTDGIVKGGIWPPVTAVIGGSDGRGARPDIVEMAIFLEGGSSTGPSQLRFRCRPEVEFTFHDD